jgi:hypothetical protein
MNALAAACSYALSDCIDHLFEVIAVYGSSDIHENLECVAEPRP